MHAFQFVCSAVDSSPTRAGFFIAAEECFKSYLSNNDTRHQDDAGSAPRAIDGTQGE